MSVDRQGGSFMCVSEKYKYGLGVGLDSDYSCGKKIMGNFFEGGPDGCTMLGDRERPAWNFPVKDCCTLGVDPDCPKP
jgi:hypothetical protein